MEQKEESCKRTMCNNLPRRYASWRFCSILYAKNGKNGIALVSYQGEGTPGRILLEKRITIFDGKVRKCLADVKRFEFSGHNSRNELFEILDRIKGNPKVLTVHGDGPSCTKFAEEITDKYGYDAKAPNIGEVVEV